MSRKYNIRWQQSDSEELKRVVKNFNAKIRRLEKKYPQNKNALPEKVSVRQIKELIETRNDLKRELKSLERFTKRGSEELINVPGNDYNLKITKWQKEEMTRRIGVINRKRKARKKMLEDIELTSRGKKLGYKKGDVGMGKDEEVALKPMKAFSPKMTRTDLKMKFKNILKESQEAYWHKRDIQLKANYIQALEENFNPNDIQDVVNRIENMNFKEFKKIFDAEGGNFDLAYPLNDEDKATYLTALKSTWMPNRKGK